MLFLDNPMQYCNKRYKIKMLQYLRERASNAANELEKKKKKKTRNVAPTLALQQSTIVFVHLK